MELLSPARSVRHNKYVGKNFAQHLFLKSVLPKLSVTSIRFVSFFLRRDGFFFRDFLLDFFFDGKYCGQFHLQIIYSVWYIYKISYFSFENCFSQFVIARLYPCAINVIKASGFRLQNVICSIDIELGHRTRFDSLRAKSNIGWVLK